MFMLVALLVFLLIVHQFSFLEEKGLNKFEFFRFDLKFWNEVQDKFILTSFVIRFLLIFLIHHEVIIHNLSLVFLSFLEVDIFKNHDFMYNEINLNFSLSLSKYLTILYLMNKNFAIFHLKNLFEVLMF